MWAWLEKKPECLCSLYWQNMWPGVTVRLTDVLLIISGHQWSSVAQKNNQACAGNTCYWEQIMVCYSHSLVFIDNKENKAYDQIYPLSINQRQRGTQADSSLQRLTEPRQRGQVSKLNTSIPAQHQQPAYSHLGAICTNSTCQSMDLDLSPGPILGPEGGPAISPEARPHHGEKNTARRGNRSWNSSWFSVSSGLKKSEWARALSTKTLRHVTMALERGLSPASKHEKGPERQTLSASIFFFIFDEAQSFFLFVTFFGKVLLLVLSPL